MAIFARMRYPSRNKKRRRLASSEPRQAMWGKMAMGKPLWMLLLGLVVLPLTTLQWAGATDGKMGGGTITANNALFLDGNEGDDWPGYGRTFGEQHFSPLSQINDRDVGRLKLAWSLDLGPGNPATQPVEVGGVLYFSSGMSIVHAVDVRTGKLLWRYDSNVRDHAGREMRVSWGIRGVAWWNGKVYTATVDGRLIALDARTGKELWTVQTTTKGDGRFISGAPRAFDGKIIIGQGGGDTTTNRGYATAYDAETGKQIWRVYIVPGNPANGFENKAMEMAAKTWTGEWWKFGGGGEPWNAFTYDAETDTIMIGTGNGYPWNHHIRSPGGGDNLFLCSLLAVDAKTGAYKWHYQYNPGESWDYNSTMDMELADLMIDGKPRKVVMSAPKNGFFYVIDRTNGQLISAEKIAKVTWATSIDITTGRPVEIPAARFPNGQDGVVWPTTSGAHSWMPMAFSPMTRLVYIPKIEHGMSYNDRGFDPKTWKPAAGSVGLAFGPPPSDPLLNTSALLAWNPVTQKLAWKVDTIGGFNGGILATAGNLVFQGQLNGRFSAYAADTGKELWQFPAQAAVMAAPISYRVDGRQYVTVLVGMGTSAAVDAASHGGIAIDARTQRKRVLTFVLDGKAALPPAPPPFIVKALPDPGYRPDPALAAKGESLFINCIACHGWGAISGGGAPDLRASPVVLSAEAFDGTVRGGGLVGNGMPKFDELSDQDLAGLRQYVRSRAADLRSGEAPPTGSSASYVGH
jgi:quinohemoprotein ethanol dehydrogenase